MRTTAMEPMLQFDPANLAVWFVRVPTAREEDDVLTAVARAALVGDNPRAIARVKALAGPARVRAENVLGSVWHEQRHFVDVLLTNYGQATMRHITNVAMNVPYPVRAAVPSGRIGLPLSVYRDEVRRRIVKVALRISLSSRLRTSGAASASLGLTTRPLRRGCRSAAGRSSRRSGS